MKKRMVIFVGLWMAGSAALGDKWFLRPEVKDTKYQFGDTRIVLHYDSTQNQRYPTYKLSVYAKDELLGEYPDVGFEQVFASPDNAYFVGLSNDGLIKQAYVIFDSHGKILKIQPHDPLKVRYYGFSVTLERQWYDQKKPQPEFRVVDGELKDISVHVRDGQRVSLLTKTP